MCPRSSVQYMGAGFAGDVGTSGACHQRNLLFVLRQLHDRKGHAGGRNVRDNVDAAVVPVARYIGSNVGLVLSVGGDHLDWFSQYAAAEVLDCHLDGLDRTLPADIGVNTAHICKHTDFNRIRICRISRT